MSDPRRPHHNFVPLSNRTPVQVTKLRHGDFSSILCPRQQTVRLVERPEARSFLGLVEAQLVSRSTCTFRQVVACQWDLDASRRSEYVGL